MEVLNTTELLKNKTKRFIEIFEELTDEYTQFVDSLSEGREGDVFWWTTNFASRNTSLSLAQQRVAFVLLILEELSYNNDIRSVQVSEYCIGEVLRRYFFSNRVKCEISGFDSPKLGSVGWSVSSTCKILRFVVNNLRTKCALLYFGKRRKQVISEINKNDILIHSYILNSEFESGRFISKDFDSIDKYLSDKIIWYPCLVNNNGWPIKKIVKICSEDKNTFIFRELWISIFDCFKVFGLLHRYFSFYYKRVVFQNIDIAPIVNEDISSSARSFNTYYGILDFYAVMKMKKKGIVFSKVIDWYEGQPSSLGFMMAIRELYKNARTVGYTGYPIDEKWIQMAPSVEQIKQRVVPDSITVIGEAYVKLIKKYYSNYYVAIVPGFRYKVVHNHGLAGGKKQILLSLPYSIQSSRFLLNFINEVKLLCHYDIVIRNHPDNREMTIEKYGLSNAKFRYSYYNKGSYAEAVEDCGAVIMYNDSMAGMEAILMGKKVIYVMERGVIGYTGNPREWKNRYYYEVYEPGEVERIIDRLFDEDSSIGLETEYYLNRNYSNVKNLFK